MTDILRLILRGLAVCGLLLLGLVLAALIELVAAVGASRLRISSWWHRQLCRMLRVEIRCHGNVPRQPALVVCNHVSWLDIPVIAALMPTRFVSKAEVAEWPVIGRLARASGTEFHRRGGHGTRGLVTRMIAQLETRQSVTIFPEGTTTLGTSTRRFQPRLFAAAIESGVPVAPVLLRYGPDPETATTAPYVGDDMFVPHLMRLLQRPRIVVDVWFMAPLASTDTDRTNLARAAQLAVDKALDANPPELLPEREPALPRHRWST